MDSFFSIVIPVYNTGCLLKRCVESIKSQTFGSFEVVLVDDGSTDGLTSGICDAVAASDARFRVLHCNNGGVAIARNRGFETSTAEYVLYIDADDVLHSDTVLDSLHQLSIQYPDADIIKGGYQRVCGDCRKEYSADADMFFDDIATFLRINLQAKCGGFTWNTVYRRSRIIDYKLRMEPASMEDHIFFLKYLELSKCALLTKNILYDYYDTPGSVSYSPRFSAFDICDEALYERQLYLKIFSEDDAPCMRLIDEGLSSNINRALYNLYHFEKSYLKRKQFVEKAKSIRGFVPSLKCLTFPMPFVLRDILLYKKYGK